MKFIIIFGPPAVGKMSVGRELAEITGYKLLHGHMTIELILEFFEYGTPKFKVLNSEFRRRIMEEVATSDLPGLIYTYVWGFNLESEKKYIERISEIFTKEGGEVYFVELYCELDERLRRNKTRERLAEKPSKRQIKESEIRLLELEKKYVMNTQGDFYFKKNYIRIDNTNLNQREVAEKIKEEFNL
ncbi:MAG: AAA family ATPase [Candidatus Thorarchaeota archaeon]